MSYRDVRGRWWSTRGHFSRAIAAPFLGMLGVRSRLRQVVSAALGVALAWGMVDVGYWVLFQREPALRLDDCRGLVPVSASQALRTHEGRAYQPGFNAYGSVRIPAPLAPRRRVLLLGDSELASYALSPSEHMGALLARRFPDIEFVCQAQANYSVSDYIRLARCLNRFGDYDLVIIEGCELDVGPEAFDRSRGRGLAYAAIDNGAVTIAGEPVGWVGRHLAFYNAYYRLDAVARRFQPLLRGVVKVLRHPRGTPAAPPTAPAAPATGPSSGQVLLSTLRDDVQPPIVWLYVQRIHGVGTKREADFIRDPSFLPMCRELGFTVVDPTEAQASFRSASGGYANGNAWTQPGTGHLNADGHRLLYEAAVPSVAALAATATGQP